MALTYSRQVLSGSNNGRPILVATITTPGTTIHTVGPTATNGRDELHIYAWNNATASQPLRLELGGTATTDDILLHLAAQGGPELIIPGMSFTATTSIIRAYSTGTATDLCRIMGWVNRAT